LRLGVAGGRGCSAHFRERGAGSFDSVPEIATLRVAVPLEVVQLLIELPRVDKLGLELRVGDGLTPQGAPRGRAAILARMSSDGEINIDIPGYTIGPLTWLAYYGISRPMKTTYTARAYRNPGRKSFSINFRHPLKMENGRPGRKVCKGLGTDSEPVAKRLEGEMNELLERTDLHSLASRQEAARVFDPLVVDIFYEDLDPASTNHRAIRERHIKLPSQGTGYIRSIILGITGAGKSTLLQRLIGCEGDRFPSTSVNRTTTCEIEVITGHQGYAAVVTFLTRHQTQQEVIESLSAAVLKAIEEGSDDAVATEFLEQSDQRFRLKYLLGAWEQDRDEEDIFALAPGPLQLAESDSGAQYQSFLGHVLRGVRGVATHARGEVQAILGSLDSLQGDEHDYALDEMQQVAERSDEFLDLVSEVMDEIAERFQGEGFSKSSTGWPETWTISLPGEQREEFLNAVRGFCGTSKAQWGQLLTPLVTGIRVHGPFRPDWVPANADYHHVFIDTEGLLHARTTTEVPVEVTSLFKDVDTILLVESAKNALHSPTAGKVFEAVTSTGYTSKFGVAFTHMDMVTGDNLTTAASKRAHVFGGVRNVLDNQVARSVSRDAARQLATHLENSTIYFAYLDPKRYPSADQASIDKFESRLGNELWALCEQLVARGRPQVLQPALPVYSFEALGLAVQEVSVGFLEIYDARLGYKRSETINTAPWQSIKAMSRRYAEGWFDGFWLNPIDTLISVTRNVLTRFLEGPLSWEGKQTTDAEKSVIVDRLKQVVNDSLTELSKTRLWKVPQANWQNAYGVSGPGSTYTRKQRVRDIFQHQVPVPQSISDRWSQAWIEEIKKILKDSIEVVRAEQDTSKKERSTSAEADMQSHVS